MTEIKELLLTREPLNEVVFGFVFAAEAFSPVHYAQYWEEIKKDFPSVRWQPPILRMSQPGEVLEKLPFPRVWFETDDSSKLIQLQADRFHYNWRRLEKFPEYRKFKNLLPEFLREWKQFVEWSQKKASPSLSIKPLGVELAYINHYSSDIDWTNILDNSRFLPFFDIKRISGLLIPEAAAATFRFSLPDGKGHLTVTLKQGVRQDDAPVQVLELTARKEVDMYEVDDWFIVAHNTIIEMFERLTPKEMLELWKQ